MTDMSAIHRESCGDDCYCVICRELKDCRMAGNVEVPQGGQGRREGINFILRRGLPFVTRSPSKEWLETDLKREDVSLEEKCHSPEVTPVRKTEKDVAHKTVIYFGDSNQRQKENRLGQRDVSSPITSREESRMSESRKEETDGVEQCKRQQRSMANLTENEDTKVTHEIVVNVSPSREDVLKIEEDESQVEDYWSLPGDNSGFKADWSFVQQWRLRG